MGGACSSVAQWNVVFIAGIVGINVAVSWKIIAIAIVIVDGNVNTHPLIIIMIMLLMKVLLLQLPRCIS